MRFGAAIGAVVALASAQAAQAQDAAAADRQAKIATLEAEIEQLKASMAELPRIEAELAALRGAAPGAAAAAPTATARLSPSTGASGAGGSSPPTTANTADTSPSRASGALAKANDHGAHPVFGPGTPSTAAVARYDAGHPLIATPDGRFSAGLLGVMQFDVADYFQKRPGPLGVDLRRAGAAADNARARNLSDGSNFRRARIGIAGKAFGSFEYTVLLDFGGSGEEDNGHVQELWLQYSGWKPAHIRVGAFPPLIGLEDAGSTNGMIFLERPTSAEIARGVAAGDFREAGQIAFAGKRYLASAAITGRLTNTTGASTVQPYNSPLGFVGRAVILPVKTDTTLLHMGVHGSYVDHPADTGGPDAAAGTLRSPVQFRDRPELRVDGTRLIDTGTIDASHAYSAGAEIAAQHKNLMIQAEYERLGIQRRDPGLPDPHFHGYYVEGSWIITGEHRRYNDGNYAFDGPQVKGSFNPAEGNYGAWELALRWSDTDLNYRQGVLGAATPVGGVRGGEQKIVTVGLNWYLNSIARIMFDYQHVDIAHLSPNAATFQTPLGADVGQRYSTASARFQLAF